MVRRTITECDLCKNETESISKVTVERKFDLCEKCFSKIMEQFTKGKRLRSWSFYVETVRKQDGFTPPRSVSNEKIPKAKERTRALAGGPERVEFSKENCPHLNKTRPDVGEIEADGKKKEIMCRKCVACGKVFPLPTKGT